MFKFLKIASISASDDVDGLGNNLTDNSPRYTLYSFVSAFDFIGDV